MEKNRKKVRRRKKSFKRNIPVIIALLVLVLFVVGGTAAYLTAKTNSLENRFSKSTVTCDITEEVEDGSKNSVKVKNTGTADAFIRVAVVANSLDENGEITGSADVSDALANDGWVKNEDYWYWTASVKPDGLTGELLKAGIDLEDIQVIILADAIQSEGVNASGTKAVVEAWGVDPLTLKD